MTIHTQATGLNKLNSGARGHFPETGAHTGNHHDAGMAGDAPAALGQVAQRLLDNGSSAGLMDAINTSQGTLGNRHFMRFIEAAVAPVSDPGNEPLQMMWSNLGRRVVNPLMGASVFRPGGTSRTRPGPVANLPLNPRRNAWDKDIVFGAEHPDTQDLAIKLEASTNAAIPRQRFRYLNKPVPPGFGDTFLWSEKVFNFADRNKLNRRDVPYMAYAREAIATALARGGKINWALGRLDFGKVFAELFRVESEYGTDPVRYMAEVSFPDLVDRRGKYIDARTGEEVAEPMINLSNPSDDVMEELDRFSERAKNGEIKDVTPFQPLITTTEIIGFLMGDERKYLDETSFFDARHQEAERTEFVSAFSGVLDRLLARRPEIGPGNEYQLEAPVYRPLDQYSGFPCGQCTAVFKFGWELEEHWKSFPGHRPLNHVDRLHSLHAHQAAGGPTGVMPGTDSGNDPVQMMWRNPGRRVLPGLRNKSALHRDRASRIRPTGRRDLSTSPRRQDWNRDILFGATSAATLELAVKLEAATDSSMPRPLFKLLDRVAPHDFPVSNLWDKPAFDFADRNQITRRDLPYMAYAREAIATAMERGGKIHWALGRLHFDNVFSDLFRVRMEHGQDPVKYMAEVSYPDLMDKHGVYIDADTGQAVAVPPLNLQGGDTSELEKFHEFHRRVEQGRIKSVTPFQPLITTVELIGFLLGDEKTFLDRTSFFDARHRKVDREEFLADFSGVHDQLRSRQAEFGPEISFILEPEVYRPLDLYSGYPCGHCDKVFRVEWRLENHWKSFPDHRP